MTRLFLFITDPALRDAVIEQIDATRFGAPQALASTDDLVAACATQAGAVASRALIVDRAAFDKKRTQMLREVAAQPNPPALLLLGDGEDNDVITETFALPLRLGHLVARLVYHLETAPLLRNNALRVGFYHLETHNRRLLSSKNGEAIRLTEKETALLAFLANSARPVTRRDILAEVWGYDERIDTHTLETHLYQLRRKLDGPTARDDGAGDNWLIFEDGAYRLGRPS